MTKLTARSAITIIAMLAMVSYVAAQDWQTHPVPNAFGPGTWKPASDNERVDDPSIAWYRCYVKVPKNWTDLDGRPLWYESVTLTVSDVADAHEVFVNGIQISGAGKMPPEFVSGREETRRYKVPPGSLQADQYNTIAIRIYTAGDEGGFVGKPPILAGYFLECVLQGDWEFKAGDDSAWAIGASRERPAHAVFDEFTEATSALSRPAEFTPGKRIPPNESLAAMTVADDLEVDIVLSEPTIAQALSMNFDERGRLWLSEYRQYPYPAGVKMVSRDKYYRAVYDKPLLPPPHHHHGLDRISIHEDTNGDGAFDRSMTFVDKLNIATSGLKDHDGVWVLNPPYLLFYPDQDQDDVPDGDPVVHLRGFGLSDTHSTANSLHFSPDGWLYGAQGSSIVSHIHVGPEKKQTSIAGDDPRDGVYCEGAAIWRYDPATARFEFFAEGGGNAFGIEIDSQGRLYSGHNGGGTRGYYYVQGGIYEKGTDVKFGDAGNPYAFGRLPFMQHAPIPRFSHAFVKYESDVLPETYRGKLLSVDPLHRNVILSDIVSRGSSFGTSDVGVPLQSDAITFRPVDIRVGPDGAIYIADYCEEFIAHGQHFQGMLDPESGRVFRVRAKGSATTLPVDLSRRSTAELVQTLRHPQKWQRQTALRLIGNRQDDSVAETLHAMIHEDGQVALEALWALHQLGHLDESLALQTLSHTNPHVRRWTVRLLGDRNDVSNAIADRMIELAATERDAEVRCQLAASARRLPVQTCVPIVKNLSHHDQDVDDDFIPLMLWWAMESQVAEHPDEVLGMFESALYWHRPLVAEALVARIMRRFASSGHRQDLVRCARLWQLAPSPDARSRLMTGFEEAYRGRVLAGLPVELAQAFAKAGVGSLALKVRLGTSEAIDEALELLADDKTLLTTRIELAQVFGEIDEPRSTPVLLKLLQAEPNVPLQSAALTSLQGDPSETVAREVLRVYSTLQPEVREVALMLLVSRKSWAAMLLTAIDNGEIEGSTIPVDTIRKLAVHQDERIAQLMKKHFGETRGATNVELGQRIEQLAALLSDRAGDVYAGKQLFADSCGKCHQLFREGGDLGPDLTQYQREDVQRMLLHVVNPNIEIREGFETYMILTDEGRVVSGFIADQDQQVIVMRGSDGQTSTISRDTIEDMSRQSVSMMPEGLLDQMTDEQVSDLFAYLRASQPIFK